MNEGLIERLNYSMMLTMTLVGYRRYRGCIGSDDGGWIGYRGCNWAGAMLVEGGGWSWKNEISSRPSMHTFVPSLFWNRSALTIFSMKSNLQLSFHQQLNVEALQSLEMDFPIGETS
jgi:hypothetical protein